MTGRLCVRVEHSTRVPFPAARRKLPGARGFGEVSLKSGGASRNRLCSRAFGGSPKAALGSSAPPGVALARFFQARSRENVFHHVAMYVGKPEIAAAEPVRELLVIDAEHVQDGGVEVVESGDIFHRVVAEI